MTTLHDRLADLADDAPPGGPAPDLWERGLRYWRRQVGSVAVVAATVVALGVLGVAAWSRAEPAPVPAGPDTGMRLPDHIYSPSSRLPGTDHAGALGPVSAVIATQRDVGFRESVPGVVGVSASTGEYRFFDLPGFPEANIKRPEGILVVPGAVPSADGRHIAYEYVDPHVDRDTAAQPTDGIRVYDTVTEELQSYELGVDDWILQSGPAWVGDELWFVLANPEANDGEIRENDEVAIAWAPDEDPSEAQERPRITRVDDGNVQMQDLPYGVVNGEQPPSEVVGGAIATWDHGLNDPTTFRVADAPRSLVAVLAAPDGGRLAMMRGLNEQTALGNVIVIVPPRAGAPATSQVIPGLEVTWLWGWRDDDHVVTERRGTDLLRTVDVETGESAELLTLEGDVSPDFARDALTAPLFDAPEPPYPLDPVLTAGLGAGILLVGSGAFVLWRRRVRP